MQQECIHSQVFQFRHKSVYVEEGVLVFLRPLEFQCIPLFRC